MASHQLVSETLHENNDNTLTGYCRSKQHANNGKSIGYFATSRTDRDNGTGQYSTVA